MAVTDEEADRKLGERERGMTCNSVMEPETVAAMQTYGCTETIQLPRLSLQFQSLQCSHKTIPCILLCLLV